MNPTPPENTDHDTGPALKIPQHWSPEQALAVWECLENLAWLIWDRYQVQLIDLIQPNLDPDDTAQPDPLDPDDDIPF